MFLIQVQMKTSDAFRSKETLGKEKLNECPAGLCFTKVCSSKLLKFRRNFSFSDEIRVISDNYKILTFCFSSGEFISEAVIDTNHDFPGGKLPKIRFARNHQNNLYLADMANFCILITDTEGAVKNIIGQEGFGLGHFKQPAGLTFDSVGNLLAIGMALSFFTVLIICNHRRYDKTISKPDKDSKNNRILCFSSDGEPLGELSTIGKSQKPKRPSDCFLIDQNSLFVIALDGNCYIYKLTL